MVQDIQTKAIVLNTIKYQEHSLIVKCYTQTQGVQSFLIKGVLTSKKKKFKPAFFQPLSQLEINYKIKKKESLHYLTEVKISYPYQILHTDFGKQSVMLFLTEMLSNSLHETQEDTLLFEFIETSLQWYDSKDSNPNFHLFFLIELTKHFGFYPNSINLDALFFDLQEGKFTSILPRYHFLKENQLHLFKKLLTLRLDNLSQKTFFKQERQELLTIIIGYFELHLGNFKHPKSLKVLSQLF